MNLKSAGIAFIQKLKHVSYCMSKHKQTRHRKKKNKKLDTALKHIYYNTFPVNFNNNVMHVM